MSKRSMLIETIFHVCVSLFVARSVVLFFLDAMNVFYLVCDFMSTNTCCLVLFTDNNIDHVPTLLWDKEGIPLKTFIDISINLKKIIWTRGLYQQVR